jgi:hypothetical protein
VSDGGLQALAPLKNLRGLDLPRTGVSDASVPTLAALGALRFLDVRESKITNKGVAELKKALPDCRILR